MQQTRQTTGLNVLLVAAGLTVSASAFSGDEISAETFDCIRDMTPVRGFFVDNLAGNLDATLQVANSPEGGRYPEGSVVQLVPTEVMVKRETGFSPATNDWEFFELEVSPEGSKITARGFVDVVNRFGGNCFACHVKAEPQWDLVCEQGHGCDPIPLTPTMLRAIQKTDPRCEPVPLSDEEKAALKALASAMPAAE
ncbi:hypothetical protein FV139_04695 [Parahaliea maris]|uniref:Cytochrome P460 n=1 Tax=Parahaliea maris TaxID=2716870 RepID=A0A5C9A2V0_9GAMM|nr:hypothetical protein [Parahaliea maris]TXS95203.1 hypothetical protein FV139_04695 [Parahaliea maris]